MPQSYSLPFDPPFEIRSHGISNRGPKERAVENENEAVEMGLMSSVV